MRQNQMMNNNSGNFTGGYNNQYNMQNQQQFNQQNMMGNMNNQQQFQGGNNNMGNMGNMGNMNNMNNMRGGNMNNNMGNNMGGGGSGPRGNNMAGQDLDFPEKQGQRPNDMNQSMMQFGSPNDLMDSKNNDFDQKNQQQQMNKGGQNQNQNQMGQNQMNQNQNQMNMNNNMNNMNNNQQWNDQNQNQMNRQNSMGQNQMGQMGGQNQWNQNQMNNNQNQFNSGNDFGGFQNDFNNNFGGGNQFQRSNSMVQMNQNPRMEEPPMQQQRQMPIDPKDQISLYNYKPMGAQPYIFEFSRRSNKGCVVGRQMMQMTNGADQKPKSDMNQSMAFDEADQPNQKQEPVQTEEQLCMTLRTDDDRGAPNCKAMSKFPIQFDDYLKNNFYFQFRIEENYDEQINMPPGQFWKGAVKLGSMGAHGVKMSIGFAKENFDLNKNSILENKGKDYWVLDLFDGEACSGKSIKNKQPPFKYMQPQNYIRKGDIVGCSINMEVGTIEYYKNGKALGTCFQEGMSFRKNRTKLFPFVQLYKCKVSVFGHNDMLAKSNTGMYEQPNLPQREQNLQKKEYVPYGTEPTPQERKAQQQQLMQQQQQMQNMGNQNQGPQQNQMGYQQQQQSFNQNQMGGGNQNNQFNQQQQQFQNQNNQVEQQKAQEIMNIERQQQQMDSQLPKQSLSIQEHKEIHEQLDQINKQIGFHEDKIEQLKRQKEQLNFKLNQQQIV